MKKVKVSLAVWKAIIKELRELRKANKALNEQIKAYNQKFTQKDA